jgi:hypothetical protein
MALPGTEQSTYQTQVIRVTLWASLLGAAIYISLGKLPVVFMIHQDLSAVHSLHPVGPDISPWECRQRSFTTFLREGNCIIRYMNPWSDAL